MYTIIVTGSRNWTDAAIIKKVVAALVSEFGYFKVVHGNARGADKHFDWYAKQYGIRKEDIDAKSADWNHYGKAAGPIRNREMLDAYPPNDHTIVVAFPNPLTSKGTYDMIEESKKRGYSIRIYDSKGDHVSV